MRRIDKDKWINSYHCFMAMTVIVLIMRALWTKCWIYVVLNLFIWMNSAIAIERLRQKKIK